MKTEYFTGNFKLDIEGDFNDASRDSALTAGLRYIVQRDVASKAYKELLGEDGEKRKDVEFSDENAANVEQAFADAMAKYGNFTVSVSQHVPGEAVAPRAMATAMWEQVKTNDALRANLGVAKGATDEVGIEACHKFLSGLRKQPKKA